MKKIVYILIISLNTTICVAEEVSVEFQHTNEVKCSQDATNPMCMELWDILESLS